MKAWLNQLQYDATPDVDECITMLGKIIPQLHQLQHIAQDCQWHGEGNVLIHTGMVLEELYRLLAEDARHIQGWQRQALILATLLHDIGKIDCTKEADIKGEICVVSPRHEARGRSVLAFKLMALDLPFSVVWTVLGLVGEHHQPKLLVVKNKDRGEYLSLSRRANIELLYWLERADMCGRICPDLPAQLSILEEFKLFAEEYDVWHKEYYPVEIENALMDESSQAREYIWPYAIHWLQNGQIIMPQEALARCYQHKKDYANLIVLCGPSGIGKSSFVKQHYPDYKVISLDDIRQEINGDRACQKQRGQVLNLAKARLKACLRQNQNLVWDATNLRSDFRKMLCDLGRDYSALVTLVVFLAPETEIAKGNAKRKYAIPSEVLNQQLASYQFPSVDEAHRYIAVDHQGRTLWKSGFYPEHLFKEVF